MGHYRRQGDAVLPPLLLTPQSSPNPLLRVSDLTRSHHKRRTGHPVLRPLALEVFVEISGTKSCVMQPQLLRRLMALTRIGDLDVLGGRISDRDHHGSDVAFDYGYYCRTVTQDD